MKKIFLSIALMSLVFSAAPAGGQYAYRIVPVTLLPATCNPNNGEVRYLTTGAKGLYSCSAVNTWSLITSGGNIPSVASLPATCAAGTLAYLTAGDTGIYSCSPADTWSRFDTGGFFNVKAYGAKGDNTADDTSSIQAAIDAARPLNGRVFLPPGVYKTTAALTIRTIAVGTILPSAGIEGSGNDSVIRYTGAGTVGLVIGDPADDFIEGSEFKNFILSGAPGTGDAMQAYNVFRCRFSNIKVPSAGAVGINLLGVILSTFENVHVSTNEWMWGGGVRAMPTYGWRFQACPAPSLVAACNANTFIGCSAEGITTAPGIGFDWQAANDNSFTAFTTEGNTVGLNALAASGHNIVMAAHFETNGTDMTGTPTANNTFLELRGPIDGNFLATAYLTNYLNFTGKTFATLGTPADGTFVYCTDCTIASPCAGGGTGALAKRLNGAWVCN